MYFYSGSISRITIIFLMLIIGVGGEIDGQERQVSRAKEDLLFQDIPVVITAARKEQPITEAPTTITVITSEDIRCSGAVNIPDVLRMVAGVDVMTITARDQQVGIRGFNGPMSNKLLVLIDGRSVYMDLYGHVLWNTFPVGLQEIDRIEVVKSPASSLYGANAFSGVINIITKTPRKLQGTELHLTVGTRDTFIGTLLHGGEAAAGKIRWKVSAEWDKTGEWGENENGEEEKKSGEITRVNALVEYRPGERIKLAVSGGRAYANDKKFLAGEFMGQGKLDNAVDYFQLNFQYGNLECRTFYRRQKGNVQWAALGEMENVVSAYDAEVLHSPGFRNRHSLVWGVHYRYNKLTRSLLFREDYRQHLWALFLEDEIKISEKLRLTLGGRYDYHDLVGGRFSPRGNISFFPGKNNNHMIRLSAARAFRNPSFLDSYEFLEEQLKRALPPPLPPVEIPFLIISMGNQDLKPEGIRAFELGYRFRRGKRFMLSLDLFYHQYVDFFRRRIGFTYYEKNELFPGSPGGVFPKTAAAVMENGGDAWGMGGEVNLDFRIRKGISGFINYSFQQITDKEDDPNTTAVDETRRVRPEYPRHKLNGGLRFIFKNGISVNLLAHWVAETKRLLTDRLGNFFIAPVDDYFILNTRVGVVFWREKGELALSVFNLFNNEHYQFPTQENLAVPLSSSLGRRITLTLRLKF